MSDFEDFKKRFKLLAQKSPSLVVNTLSNIFTMRLIGNKTHGDLAEIGLSEFINQFMYDFKSEHVGKDRFRSKTHEEDISRKHPIFLFLDRNGDYICEVRYGGASANALQRGLWTNTKNAIKYFDSLTSGWIDYSHNQTLVKLFKLALNSSDRFKHEKIHDVIKQDIFETLKKPTVYDLAYFDPPYGSNNEKMPPSRVRYAAYYHIWSTIIKHDKPAVFGKANRREDSRDTLASSVFEEFRKDDSGTFIAMQAIKEMICKTKSKYVLLSYSSGGRATKQELCEIIENSGELIKSVEIDYKHNVMAQMRWTDEWINSDNAHHEYLFLMKKG